MLEKSDEISIVYIKLLLILLELKIIFETL